MNPAPSLPETESPACEAAAPEAAPEAALAAERHARERLEALLRQRETEFEACQARLRSGEMRVSALTALQERALPAALLPTLCLDSPDTLNATLSAVEGAFRAAVEAGVRERLRFGGVPAPLDPPAAPLTYRQAAALYSSDRAAYDRKFGGK